MNASKKSAQILTLSLKIMVQCLTGGIFMTESNSANELDNSITGLFSNLSSSYTAYLRKLVEGGVPVETWGTEGRKPLEAFFEQLESGEASLKVLDGKPIRCIRVATVSIVYTDESQKYRLIEARQEFTDGKGRILKNSDGSKRIKSRKLKSSMSETIRHNEDPIEGAVRGIEEELGILIDPNDLIFIEQQTEYRNSNSYAGLQTRYEVTRYRWEMPSKFYKASYRDDREIKRGERLVSHFEWVPNDSVIAA